MSRGRELAKVGGVQQTISGISTFVGISTFATDVRIHGKLDVDGDISYDEMTSVNSKVTGVSTLTDARIDRNLYVAGIATVTGTSTFTGAIDANGGATIDNIQIGITDDNEIDTASGNLTIDSAGGTVTIDDAVAVTGNLTVTGNTVANGDVDLGNATGDTITATGRFDSDLVPSSDDARDLGSSTLEWKDLYIDGTANIDSLVADTADINGGSVDGATVGANSASSGAFTTLSATGDVDLGNATSDTITATGRFDSDLVPSADGTYDLGATANEWQDLWIDGTANIDSLVADTADINGGSVDGATVGAASASSGAFTTLSASGQTDLNGDINLGNANTDSITPTGRFDAHIIPLTDNAVDLGASGVEFKDLYLDGTANIDALVADTAIVSDLTDNRVVLAGSSGELEDSANLTFDGSTLALTGSQTVSANLTVTGVLDTDGHTNLDNVSVSGVSTTTGAATFSAGVTIAGALDANGGASIDNIQIGVTGDNELDTSSGNLTIDSAGGTTTIDDNATVTGNLTVTGDLQVNGTNTTVASTTMTVADKNVVVAQGAANDAAADGAGLTVDSGDGDKTWNWVDSTDAWTSSEHINIASGKAYYINGASMLSATALGNTVVSSSLTSVGTIASGTWQGTAVGNDYIATITAANKIGLSALDIDGATDIGADIVDADLFAVDDGAGGTNRKTTGTRIKKYIWSSASGDATASDAGAITLAASGVSAGTVGSSSAIPILTIDAKGRITGTTTASVDSTAIAQGNTSMTAVDSGTGSIVASVDGTTTATIAAAGITLGQGAFVGAVTGNVTGDVTGNADSATLATTVTCTANNTANETVYPTFVDGATGTQGLETDTGLSYNPSTNSLTAGTFIGALTGTASNAALLDSLDSSQFLRSDASDTYTGTLTVAGNVVPDADSSRDLGTNSVRFANIYGDDIYAGDIHMSNEHRGGNTVDGTWGSYLFEEGENDLFITNRRSGKKFRLVLEAI